MLFRSNLITKLVESFTRGKYRELVVETGNRDDRSWIDFDYLKGIRFDESFIRAFDDHVSRGFGAKTRVLGEDHTDGDDDAEEDEPPASHDPIKRRTKVDRGELSVEETHCTQVISTCSGPIQKSHKSFA